MKVGFAQRMGRIMNRALATVSMRLHIATANTWRDNYNPLRSLTIARAVCLLEDGERGAYADLQWTYRFIEMQDATLGALIERRTAAIQKLDWDIKVRDKVPAGKEEIAQRQKMALESAYERVSNFSAAVEFMVMASFRGFAHLEKVTDGDGNVIEFAPVDQWFWVREGIYGQWLMNRDAKPGTRTGEQVPLPRFIIREVARPINRVALISFIRKNLSQKDWDGFIEAYGIPAVFVIMPPNVPTDKEDEYFDAAEQVTSDARGVLPGGSDIKTVDNGARGTNPFKEHLQYQDEQIVMRGTGGKLTMLSEATGIGGGATDAHSETFESIAKADAAEISEILRKQFDAEILAKVTPGEAAYAYFELAANEETDTAAVVKDVTSLNGAGYRVSSKWIAEKTGYELEAAEVPPSNPAPAPAIPRITNRQFPGWKKFRPETGTLGIPRNIMPQVRNENRAAMVAFLRARGVSYERQTAKPSDLKPTQAEYAPEKVEKAKAWEGKQRAILISSDNHIVDGHHQYMAALQTAPNVGIPVMRLKSSIMHILGLLLMMPSTEQQITNRADAKNSAAADAVQELRTALAKDHEPLLEALGSALETGDGSAFRCALRKISAELPDHLETPAFQTLLNSQLGAAWMGLQQPIRNSGNSDGARKGWETRRANGWKPANRPGGTGKPHPRRQVDAIERVLDDAFTDVDARSFTKYASVPADEAAQIRERTRASGQEAPDLTGWERIVEADKVNKILPKHGTDARPVTEEDFRRLPELLAKPAKQSWEEQKGKPPRLVSEIHEGNKVIIVEEAFTGKKQLTTLSIYRP